MRITLHAHVCKVCALVRITGKSWGNGKGTDHVLSKVTTNNKGSKGKPIKQPLDTGSMT